MLPPNDSLASGWYMYITKFFSLSDTKNPRLELSIMYSIAYTSHGLKS